GNGQSVGLSHLSIAEDLNHSRTISERLIARRRTRGTIGVDKFIGRLPSLLATPASLVPPRSVFLRHKTLIAIGISGTSGIGTGPANRGSVPRRILRVWEPGDGTRLKKSRRSANRSRSA